MESHVGFMYLVVMWFFILTQLLTPLCANQEVEALNDFRKRVDDPNHALDSWDNTLVNPCTWFHITCDNSDRVQRIDLGASRLKGTISPLLGNLANLQYLELFENQLNGSMPKELGKLVNLVSFDLFSNKLTGPIPYQFGNLKSLRILRLYNNNLCGRAPVESLSHCKKLEVVVLYPNSRLCNPFRVLIKDCPHCA